VPRLHGKRRKHNMERAVTRTPRCSQGSPAPASMDHPQLSLAYGVASELTAWRGGGGVQFLEAWGSTRPSGRGLDPDQSPPSRAHRRAETLATAPKGAPPCPGTSSLPACRTVRFDYSSHFGRSVLSSNKANGTV
jgi:hypothetical protein